MYVLFRLAHEGDFEKIREIGMKGLKAAYNDFPPAALARIADEYHSLENLQKIIERTKKGRDFFLVAEALNRVAGFCHVSVKGKVCEVKIVAVDDFFQNRGIGSRLLSKCETFAREKNCRKYTAWVNGKNTRLRHFYIKNEFRHFEERDRMDSLKNRLWHMEKPLEN